MRIDKFLSEKFGSRTKAAAMIEKGLVIVNDKKVSASYCVKPQDNVEIIAAEESFVSNGGYKLSKALKEFAFSAENKIFADIGASTGGFTDCLLKNGAKKIYCIDVGESQLDKSLISEKTVILDNYNARNLNSEIFQEDLDGIVIDVSFISLTYILGAVSDVLKNGKHVLALIKPQFECDGKIKFKGGIVKDKKLRLASIKKIYDFAKSTNLAPKAVTSAPEIKGKNLEYIMLMEKGGNCEDFEKIIKDINY